MIAVEGLYSREAYVGLWCDVCGCIKDRESFARKCFSILFRVLLFILLLISLCSSAVQVVNLTSDPQLRAFPEACPTYDAPSTN
jgi:hypothetical protein